VFAVVAAFVASALVALAFSVGSTTDARATTQRGRLEAEFLARGAVEGAKVALRDALANWQTLPAEGTVDVGGVTASWQAWPTGEDYVEVDGAGLRTDHRVFEVEASVVSEEVRVTAHRLVDLRSMPLFQFAAFYDADLEVQPGPDMELRGRVHSNRDLYLGSGSTLTLDTNYVRCAGRVLRRRKDSDASNGAVLVRRWVEDPFDPAEPVAFEAMAGRDDLPFGTPSGYDSDFEGYDADGDGAFDGPDDWLPFVHGSLELWGPPAGYAGEGHTVLTGAHGVRPSEPPALASIHMFEPSAAGDHVWDGTAGEYVAVPPGTGTHVRGHFHANAGLAVRVKADGSGWTAFGADGLELPPGTVDAALATDQVYDARQGGYVPLLRIDLAALAGTGAWPANGLLYAAHAATGEGTAAKGIELVGGEELAAPLTFVTEGGVYLRGDYNLVDPVPAAVIADAVNLLSNAWDGSKGAGELPAASATTYRCAMALGSLPTLGSSYNGGLENLPRFHEAWSGVTCRIIGSFVSPWQCERATGGWAYGGDRYTAPHRDWTYDVTYNDAERLPPFTPLAVAAEDVVSW